MSVRIDVWWIARVIRTIGPVPIDSDFNFGSVVYGDVGRTVAASWWLGIYKNESSAMILNRLDFSAGS